MSNDDLMLSMIKEWFLRCVEIRVCVVAVSSTFDMMEEGWRRAGVEREQNNMVQGERESQIPAPMRHLHAVCWGICLPSSPSLLILLAAAADNGVCGDEVPQSTMAQRISYMSNFSLALASKCLNPSSFTLVSVRQSREGDCHIESSRSFIYSEHYILFEESSIADW